MTSFEISLDVTSDIHTLAEITQYMGVTPAAGSRDKGKSYHGQTAEVTHWTMFVDTTEPPLGLSDSLTQLVYEVEHLPAWRSSSLPPDCRLTITVAAMFETAYVSLSFPTWFLSWLSEHGLDLKVFCYPCSEDESAE